ncbi:cytidylyltransferase domain-containing protein [Magnetovibrio blakemorei]|uniref:Spore coat polysaccharide biosynthesis protein F n=1 Tax=Magnetovibrio blakemorei TaxID=28181 RepID=A0A1E5Q6L7_9PROT|nr:glycosyltransferase family protein [Magnetovibrio blakemorei]OEJ66325.1 hypothetical protein BEN30_12285 [Magnetovibrio blakemorei]
MKTVAIIQARYGSSRLPGKVLENIEGQTVLSHVIERCRATRGINQVCCAIPETQDSDGVAHEAIRAGAIVVRGSELDVLGRFMKAAKDVHADVIMRVTSDCPVTDPEINARVIDIIHDNNVDYACNNMPPVWPHGLDCEVFSFQALSRAFKEAHEPYDREHVTPWMRSCPDMRRKVLAGPEVSLAGLRWTLDYLEDLQFFRALFAKSSTDRAKLGYQAILSVLEKHPEIAQINAEKASRNA